MDWDFIILLTVDTNRKTYSRFWWGLLHVFFIFQVLLLFNKIFINLFLASNAKQGCLNAQMVTVCFCSVLPGLVLVSRNTTPHSLRETLAATQSTCIIVFLYSISHFLWLTLINANPFKANWCSHQMDKICFLRWSIEGAPKHFKQGLNLSHETVLQGCEKKFFCVGVQLLEYQL